MSNINNTAGLVKDVTYFYIKYYYEQELEKTNQKKLSEIKLKELIEHLYVEKSGELKKYIRDTLKENLKENYSSFSVENIIILVDQLFTRESNITRIDQFLKINYEYLNHKEIRLALHNIYINKEK